MNRTKRNTVVLVIWIILLYSISAWSQTGQFKNGVKQGQIKVKFTAEMSTTLGQTKVNARTSGFTTGIQALDATAKSTKSKNMYRMFPYDPKFENKLRKHGLHLWYIVEMDDATDPKAAVSQFKQLKEVAVAEVEHEKILAPYSVEPFTPGATTMDALPFNDPYLKDQWHYNNTGQTGYADADINLFEAWASTTGASDIIVSVHDEGVDVNHDDLKNNIWVNADEIPGNGLDDDDNGYVDDVNGYNFAKKKGAVDPMYHGTHVAGTIAAVNNNGKGVSGVAGGNGSGNGAKIMSLQIFGGAAQTEKTFVYAANNGAVISQNSWGYSSPYYYEQSILDAIDYFVAEAGDYTGSPMKGGIVIFAAGNSNYDSEWYPGYHQNVLSVASIGPDWKKASYSNFGEWVEISAPGGEQDYGSKNGVLSTIPNNQYAYLQGTSMACPHVSGIAALALANRTKQMTNKELWNKLVTAAVSIDQYNPDYIGKLGSGAIDAALAVKNDLMIAPLAISDLSITSISQEFAMVRWTVPSDEDDGTPISFELYHHTQPITSGNLAAATKASIKNTLSAGSEFSYELDNLLGLTTYYFAVTATDRWGNVSILSNVVTETTNEGPSIAVDENSQVITIDIDAATSTSGSHEITILNQAPGVLRWNHFMRHKNTSLAYSAASVLNYPVATKKSLGEPKVAMANIDNTKARLVSNEPATLAFTPVEKSFASWPTNIIGETDLTLTNSSAAKFSVTEPDGFNLTQVKMYLKHDPSKGPVIMEVYKGDAPVKANLIYAQEHNNWGTEDMWAYITLNEQLYFEAGSSFWVVFHVPADNLFPLGIGFEDEPEASTNSFISFNLGATWTPLEDAINSEDYAWAIVAGSYNQYLGTYLTLEPGSGDVNGNEQTLTTLTADASTLINGSYSANMIITSNDAQNRELRIPVNLNVTGHKPDIKHIDIADFGGVFIGNTETLELVLENRGLGNFNDVSYSIEGTSFEIDGYASSQIAAHEQVTVNVKFKPAAAGNLNGTLTVTNGTETYEISLFGLGVLTSKIDVTPSTQIVNNVAIGDEVNATVTVKNTGAYPLKYFIPGYDDQGVSQDWPSDYHSYGYTFKTNYASDPNPIAYQFQDIKSTGTKITGLRDDTYFTLDMGFQFPYYGQLLETLYIAEKGFTVFDNSVRPINLPRVPGNEWSPKGYISPLGTYLSYTTQGEIFYQIEPDRVIVQYDNVWDGWNVGENMTVQMVLYSNGDIRFFYDVMNVSASNQAYFNILIEDLNQSDGILISDYTKPLNLYSGLALGLDYPGPNIITQVTNGSGILAPNASANVDITLSTTSLSEGTVKRYVNFISNDPANSQKNALIQLEVTSGGVSQPLVSTDTVAFGSVFQGANRAYNFTIKNPGTANVGVTSITNVNNAFTLVGDQPTVINPGLYKKYEIKIPTVALADLEDWLSINYADGSHDTIYVTGKVVVAPAINVDLSLIQETLSSGGVSTHPYAIQNTGLADLEVVATGSQWLSFSAPAATVVDNSYVYERNNTGEFYQWIDIRKDGTQLPFADFNDWDNTFWRELVLPFPIEFYGEQYTSLKIGDNGIISFEDEPVPSLFTDYIPSQMHAGPCIMPYWTFSGFADYLYPIEDIGIFYKFYDDKIIITWSYFTNNFGGMGDPVSAQIIFYNNGSMKFQYKAEEGGNDFTSNFSTIGLQKNSTTGMELSAYTELAYGEGLAYLISPAKKLVVAPGATLNGEIKIDATNLYGGQYNKVLKIQTNVPNNELLEKPIELTVTGEASFAAVDLVDFGRKMITFEYGSPAVNYVDLDFGNEGSAPLEISWAQMADGTQGLSLMLLVDGWFGPEWTPIENIYSPWAWETPTFTIKPGDKLAVRAIFYPSVSGDFSDELVLTTNIGEQRISMLGTGFEPPVMELDNSPIEVVMNTMTETDTKSITISNLNGMSELQYEVSIDYGRAATTGKPNTESMATTAATESKLITTTAPPATPVARTSSTYNRILKHTTKETPDTFIGMGGSAPFTAATKFNAGPSGFNLTHIETWFRTETVLSGTVSVEVRAGGSSIASATVIATGTLNFTGSGDDQAGAWYQIKLDEAAGIYPNEDFYVSVTYPLDIEFSQGVVNGEDTTPDRYYYFYEGLWYNIQEVGGFENMGLLMYAAEETAANTSWLSVSSDLTGVINAGEEAPINLLIDGAFSKRGDQVANVLIKSNDPNNTQVSIPVTLHMNEAPHFSNVPEAVFMSEKDVVTITIPVADAEENLFTVESAQVYPGVSSTFSDGILSITFSPEYGDAGTYAYIFTAIDEYSADSEMVLHVDVAHTNRAPEYIGADEAMQHTATKEIVEYNIADYFSDPDNDDFTFTVASSNGTVAEVFTSTEKFLVKPMAVGETTITFVTTDSHGAVSSYDMTVNVSAVLGIEDNDVNFSITAYPNPSKGKVYVHVEGEVSNEYQVRVLNSMGVTVLMQKNVSNNQDGQLDLSTLQRGVYFIEITDLKGRSTRRIVKE